MFINEAITAYMEETRTKQRRAAQLEEITRRRWNPDKYTTKGEKLAAHAAMMKEITEAAEELQPLEIELKIRHDNTRRMIYNATLPAVLDIMKKWNGKPYGEKTKQKISDEMKTRFNCALYLSNQYGGKIDIVPLNNEGYTNYNFKYSDFDIYTRYSKDGHQPHILNDNKINGEITAEDLRLSDCPDIVSDPAVRAAEILAQFAELKRKQEQLEHEISAFNNLLPSTIERRHITTFRNYL